MFSLGVESYFFVFSTISVVGPKLLKMRTLGLILVVPWGIPGMPPAYPQCTSGVSPGIPGGTSSVSTGFLQGPSGHPDIPPGPEVPRGTQGTSGTGVPGNPWSAGN